MPMKQALIRRTIIGNSIYDCCQAEVEDLLHALWTCTKLDTVWVDHSAWDFQNSVGFVDFKDLVSWIIAEGKQLELFAITAWSVWNQRNQVRVQAFAIDLHQVAAAARTSLDEFHMTRQGLELQRQQVVRSAQNQWLPPLVDEVKINFDGAMCPKKKKSGIGVVVRDVNGMVLASCVKIKHQPYKVVEIETLVAAVALSFTTDLGYRRIILEEDSMEVIQALRENTQSLTPSGLLLEDVKRFS